MVESEQSVEGPGRHEFRSEQTKERDIFTSLAEVSLGLRVRLLAVEL